MIGSGHRSRRAGVRFPRYAASRLVRTVLVIAALHAVTAYPTHDHGYFFLGAASHHEKRRTTPPRARDQEHAMQRLQQRAAHLARRLTGHAADTARQNTAETSAAHSLQPGDAEHVATRPVNDAMHAELRLLPSATITLNNNASAVTAGQTITDVGVEDC